MKILTLQDIKGHDVFEFMVGPYNEEHWKQSSIYFTEEDFSFLYPFIKDIVLNFNYYGPNLINIKQWELIKTKMKFTGSSSRETQLSMGEIFQIDKWVQICFEEHDCFTICGP